VWRLNNPVVLAVAPPASLPFLFDGARLSHGILSSSYLAIPQNLDDAAWRSVPFLIHRQEPGCE
jgi:hypothetical protein